MRSFQDERPPLDFVEFEFIQLLAAFYEKIKGQESNFVNPCLQGRKLTGISLDIGSEFRSYDPLEQEGKNKSLAGSEILYGADSHNAVQNRFEKPSLRLCPTGF
jgi:hypothetical protein